MPETRLSRRLHAAFLLVRECESVADIGTDHALLPIALVKSGKVKSAIASDINKGPLESARENIFREGLSDRIKLSLADGIDGECKSVKNFVVAGMGGELIADIVLRAPFLKSPDIHLVLQPMTKVHVLRKALWDNGFDIENEVHLEEDGHLYTVMSVVFVGEKYEGDVEETLLGKRAFLGTYSHESLAALLKMCEKYITEFSKKIKGKNLASSSTEEEEEVMEKLSAFYEEIKKEKDKHETL